MAATPRRATLLLSVDLGTHTPHISEQTAGPWKVSASETVCPPQRLTPHPTRKPSARPKQINDQTERRWPLIYSTVYGSPARARPRRPGPGPRTRRPAGAERFSARCGTSSSAGGARLALRTTWAPTGLRHSSRSRHSRLRGRRRLKPSLLGSEAQPQSRARASPPGGTARPPPGRARGASPARRAPPPPERRSPQASPPAQPRHVAERRGHAQERLLLLVHGAGDDEGPGRDRRKAAAAG